MEAIVGCVIATIAVLGLAYTFGSGRALVDRFSVARTALAVAEARLEQLQLENPTSSALLAIGYASALTPFSWGGHVVGSERWAVTAYDEPNLPGSTNLREVTVTVRWQQGSQPDSVTVQRLFPL